MFIAYMLHAKLEEYDRAVGKFSITRRTVVMDFPDEKIIRGRDPVSYTLHMADVRGCMNGMTVGEPNDPGETDRRLCVFSLLGKSVQQRNPAGITRPKQTR